jgi:hypothetical protein
LIAMKNCGANGKITSNYTVRPSGNGAN